MSEQETERFSAIVGEGNGSVDDNEAVAPIVDAIRARRAELSRERFFDVDVPGSDGMMVLRLGPVSGSVITEARARLERSNSPEREANMNADLLVRACVGVYVRASADDPLIPLEKDGEPIKLDKRLADVFGFEATTARQVCFSVFNDANVPALAVAFAAGRYIEWATSANGELDEDLLGESPGGTPSRSQARSPLTDSRRTAS